jgi:WD40 repeat protein
MGVRVWDAGTGKELYRLDLVSGVSALAFSHDGRTLAVGGEDTAVRLLDASTGEEIRFLRKHRKAISALVFSPDDKCLISGDHDGVLRVWDVARGRPLPFRLNVPDSIIHSLALSADGRTLAAGCEYREEPDRHPVILFDLTKGKQIFPPKDGQRGLEHQGAVRSLAFAPDGDSVASGGLDGRVILWDTTTRAMIREYRSPHLGPVQALAFSRDCGTLAVGCADGAILSWDAGTGEELRRYGEPDPRHRPADERGVRSLSFSRDGKLLASGGPDDRVRLWDVATGEERSPAAPPASR